jgi:hypothetical protein
MCVEHSAMLSKGQGRAPRKLLARKKSWRKQGSSSIKSEVVVGEDDCDGHWLIAPINSRSVSG